MFGTANLIGGVVIILSSILIGALVIASGQFFLAIREIALNTRKEESIEDYRTLYGVSKINNIFGWLILVGGSFVGLVMVFGLT
jgi:hypothetical protein